MKRKRRAIIWEKIFINTLSGNKFHVQNLKYLQISNVKTEKSQKWAKDLNDTQMANKHERC